MGRGRVLSALTGPCPLHLGMSPQTGWGGEGEDSFLHIPQQLPLCLAGTNKPPATNRQDLFSILLEIRGEDLGLSYSLWPPGHPLSPASVPHPPNPRSHT